VFGGCAFAIHGRRALPRRGDLLRLQGLSLLGVCLNQLFFLEGIHRSTALNAALLMPLIPVYTFLIAALVRQERFAPRRALGMLVAFASTAALVLVRADGGQITLSGGPHLVGNLLMMTNTLVYAIYLVWSRPLARRYPPIVLIAWVFMLSVWTVPLVSGGAEWVPDDAGRTAWLGFGLTLLFPTVIGYLLNVYALARVSASTTAVYIYLQPVIGGVAGVLWLNELLTTEKLLAAAGIFVGLGLVIRRRRSPSTRTTGDSDSAVA
jgi:drug/metabolite transporter (DMT)-like permease